MNPAGRARAGRWGVVIFWCVLLAVVGVVFRLASPSQSTSEAVSPSSETTSPQ